MLLLNLEYIVSNTFIAESAVLAQRMKNYIFILHYTTNFLEGYKNNKQNIWQDWLDEERRHYL